MLFLAIFCSNFILQFSAEILGDFSCTIPAFNGSVYSQTAVNCNNSYSDIACQQLYPPAYAYSISSKYPKAGGTGGRPLGCYSSSGRPTGPIDEIMKLKASISCPKTCGYCCLVSPKLFENKFRMR
ncbi:ShKT domain-containing protein [Caenorhabditis elegans]|uniref:ShKT domain-containing protein n=1 Tax=Caenorhabditis elegans TaxID=6239 RepID=O45836_CAEEL|nr:ShKT domain-containing protein [Caenorhabditis elegans]CAB03431.1 ShKT domain-containing protein [Caenorhabditis elegans]|eukprot:NP_506932.1 Uncharacterized protein CELE_T26E4.2 [Caenorhabditis elegans]